MRLLNQSEFQVLVQCLSDFDSSVQGSWLIAGSVAYRISAPAVQTKPGLHDIDLIVYSSNGEDPRLLVTPSIQKRFAVEHVAESPLGYYYRLRHRATGMDVDVFTREVEPYKLFRIGDLPVRVSSAESALFHGLVHLLMRESQNMVISKKQTYNANKLWQVVDQGGVLEFFDSQPDKFRRYIPQHMLGKSNMELIQHALSLKARGSRLGYEKPKRRRSITTMHGIKASPEDFLKNGVKTSKHKSLKQKIMHKYFRLKITLGV